MAEAKISLSIDGVQAVNSGLRQVDERLSSVTARVKDQTASVLTLSDAQARMIESNRQLAESTRFLDSLKKQTDAIGKSAADLAEMRAQALGVSEAAAPLVAKLREAEKPVEKLGITSAQTAAAMRMVPAQFTDIVVGLQSGQRPMSVLLQQGGQLKDMFGGMGPAARGLATYVVGLVNPFTLAAGAAAVLAAAYFQGRKETEAYNQALILSGNVSGKTASQLQEAAQSVSKSVGTQAEAAGVLAELAGNGKIASDSFERFTRVAVQMAQVGKPVSDTISELSELGTAPVEASEKLNEKYHYLTDTVYKQIKALQDQGKADDAAAVAEKAYADAFDQRSKMLINQLGYAEKAWNSVAGAAKRGWDAFLDVGRPDTSAEALRKGSDSAAVLQSVIDRLREPGGGLLQSAIADQLEKIVGKRKEENAYLQENARLERQGAAAQAENARLADAQIKWDKDGEQYLSRQLQLGRDIAKAREEGLAAGKSEAEINQRIGEIRKKYADIYNDQVDSQIEAIKRRGQIEDEISKRSVAQIQLQHQIGGMNDEQEIEATANAEIAAIDRRKTALQEELAIVRAKPNSLKEQQALQGQIAVLSEQRLTREKQLEGDLIKLDVTRTRAAAEYYSEVLVKQADAEAKKLQDQVLAQKDYIEEIGLSKTALADLQAARLRDLAAMKDQQASQAELTDETGEWTAKLREQAQTIRNLADGTQAAAEKQEMVDTWKSIDQAGHDAFIHIGDSGKSAFDRILDTAKSGLLDFLYQITARKWLIDITASVTGGSLSGAAQAATSSATGGGLSSFGAGAGLAGTLGSFGGGMSAGFAQLTAGVNPMAAMSSIADVSAGSLSTAIGQAIGYAGPVLAAAAAIYSIAKSLDHSGTYHTGALAQYSAAGGLQTGSNGTHAGPRAGDTNFGTGFGGVDFSRQTADFVSGISQSIVGILDSTASTFGKSAGYSAATAFADDTSRDGAWGALLISKAGEKLVDWQDTRNSKWSPHEFADGQAGQEQYLKDISQSVRTALDDIGLPIWAQHMLDALGDAPALTDLAAVVDKINAAQKALVSMGNAIAGFASLSDSAVTALITASGGVDAFSANMSSFYDGYYTESEKIANVSQQVSSALSAVGLAMPATRQEFRALVEQELALGESGAGAVAALLSVSGAFGQVADYASKTANDAIQTAKTRSSMEIQLMKLTGDAAGALAAERRNELEALDESIRPLQEQIWRMEDVATARSTLADAYDRESSALRGTIKSMTDFRHSLLTGNLSPLTNKQKYEEAAQQYADIVARKNSGDQEAINEFQGVAQQFLEISRLYNASGSQYQTDYASVLTETQRTADAAQSQLSLLDQQVNGLITLNNTAASGFTGVQQAILNLGSVMGGANVDAARSSVIENLYQSVLGRASDAQGKEFWTQALANGVSLDHIRGEFMTSPEYLRIHGSHANGLDRVPFDNYIARLHQDEAVLTAPQAMEWRQSGGQGTAALIAEIKRLNDKIERLERAVDRNGDKVAGATVAASERSSAVISSAVVEGGSRAAYGQRVANEAVLR